MNNMTDKKFINIVSKNCFDTINKRFNADITNLTLIQVWFCKTIQNYKGLFIVKDIKSEYIYPYFIEATCNGDKNEIYLDYYIKEHKETIHY